MSLLITLLYFVFILASVVLIVVVLLQEGKGGGFGQALGTSGQETFGAGARGINTFTAVCVGVFLVSAMLITILNRMHSGASVLPADAGSLLPTDSAPQNPAPAGNAPAGTPPAGTPTGG